jgi:hypothetical protein
MEFNSRQLEFAVTRSAFKIAAPTDTIDGNRQRRRTVRVRDHGDHRLVAQVRGDRRNR